MSHVEGLAPRFTVTLSIKCITRVLRPLAEADIRISSHKGGNKSAQPAGGTETRHHKKQWRLEGGRVRRRRRRRIRTPGKTEKTSGTGVQLPGTALVCWQGGQLLTWKWFSLFDCRESPLLQDIYQQKKRERALHEYMWSSPDHNLASPAAQTGQHELEQHTESTKCFSWWQNSVLWLDLPSATVARREPSTKDKITIRVSTTLP